MRTSPSACVGLRLFAIMILISAGGEVQAQNTWTGTTNNWSTASNWSALTEPTASESVVFPALFPSAGRSVDLSTGEVAGSLEFLNTYALRGGSLTLASGSITVFGGNLGTSSNGVGFGSLITSSIGGSNGLNKQGTGTLFLAGSNTFAGTVNVFSGKLSIVNDSNLGATVPTLGGSTAGFNSVNLDGGILQLVGSSTVLSASFLQVNRSINIGSNGGTIEVVSANGNSNGGAGIETTNAFTGSGTLTKTGQGQLFILNSNNFAGPIVLATTNGGSVDVRAGGAFTSAASIAINPGAVFAVNNKDGLGTFASTNNQDRIANSIPIFLNGGTFAYTGRDVAGQIREVLGTVTLNQGQSTITATSGGTTGNGGEIQITTLTRTAASGINGGGTINFTGSGTLGTTGNSGRIFIDGVANQSIVGGYATVGAEFAGYVTATGVVAANNTAFTAANPNALTTLPASGNPAVNVRTVAAGVVPDSSGSGGIYTINSLNMTGTFDLTFALGTDTLTLASGGFLSSNNNRSLGTTTTRGQITSGGPQLYFHINGSTTTVNSVVVDNGGAVALVKDQGGVLTLTAANTYTGGTYSTGFGTINTGGTADVAYLGSGPVFVNNAFLVQGAPGATTSTAGYTVVNNGRIQLAAGGVFQSDGDRYNLAAGTTLFVDNSGAGVGFNSLTRVTSLTAGGQVVLAPDTILGYGLTGTAGQDGVTVPTQGTGVRAIQNLGTAADLYFSPLTGTQSANNILVVGAGTPYKGLSTDNNGNRSYQGTIQANGDFYVQGLVHQGANREFGLGNVQALTITNTTTDPIRAFLIGNVRINTGTGVASAAFTVPSNLTFVATPGSLLTLEGTNALGNSGAVATNAKAVIESGALLNLFPDRDIVSGAITFLSGSRFLGDDNSATGSINGIGSLTFEKGSIFDQSQTNAFTGTAGLVFQAGSIIRIQASSPVLLGVPRNNAATPFGATRAGTAVVYELYNGSRILTNQATPEDVTVSGGGITNDSVPRSLDGGGGRILIGSGGAYFTATTGTTLTINDDFDLGANTLTIGNVEPSIGGNPKLGTISFGGGGSRSLAAGVIDVLPGAQLRAGATHALPDLATINVGAGGSLFLTQNDAIETVGGLTGSGTVVTDQTGTIPSPNLRVGLNNLSTTFAGAFAAGAGNPGLTKIGTGTLTLTGVNTTVRNLNVDQGTLRFADTGTGLFGTYIVAPGATLTLDNTGTVLANRLGGTGKGLAVGGTFQMLGGNVALTEAIGTFSMGSGGSAVVLITPGTNGNTTLAATTLGARDRTTLILRGANLGATPGTGVATFTATTPNLFGTLAAGTSTTALRPDVLSDTPSTGGTAPLGFVTQDNTTNGFRRLVDATEYSTSISAGSNTNLNVQLSAPFTALPSVNPTVPAADTQIQSLILNAGATSIANNAGTTLSNAGTRFVVKSGGFLVQPGVNATITTPYLDNGGTTSFFHAYGNLAVNAVLVNSNLVKAGTGTLTLGAGAVRNVGGTIAINNGAVVLGENNSFLISTGTAVTAPGLTLAGGSLDINGNDQTFNQFTSTNTTNAANLSGVGGNILNGGARAQLTILGSLSTNGGIPIAGNVFNGTIGGPIDFTKAGSNSVAFTNASAMNGSFTLRGGTIHLREAGAFTAVTSVVLNYSILQLDNRYNQTLESDNRLAAAAPLTMRGGTYELFGALGGNSLQSHPSVTLEQGGNIINSAASGGGSTELTFGTFARNAATGATVDFRGTNIGRRAPAGTANQDSRIIIGGGLPATALYSGTGPSISNGFLGGWATVNATDFASYLNPTPVTPTNAITAAGVSNWGNTALGYPAYTAATATGGGFASGNVTNVPNINVVLPAGTTTTGALRIGDNAARTLGFTTSTDLLNIESGGLLRTNHNNGTTIGTTALRGQITAGGANPAGSVDLYLHFNNSSSNVTLTSAGVSTAVAPNNVVHSAIIDNPNGNVPLRLVKDLGGAITLTAFNSYTGGTVINGGTVLLATTDPANGSAGAVSIPGNLTINNATVTQLSQGQIRNTAVVAVNNGATLNLSNNVNDNATFAALSFTNDGGGTPQITAASAVTAGTVTKLTLTGTGVTGPIITAVNNNAGSTPTIVGTSTNTQIQLDFGDNSTPRTIDVSGSSPLGLIINAPILNGALLKNGTSMLALGQPSGTGAVASSFTGGLQINAGQVRVDSGNSLGSTNTVTVGNGTLGTATALVVNTGTAIPVGVGTTLNAGLLAPQGNNITLGGTLAIQADSTIALNDYYQTTTARTVTLNGVLSGSAALTITASPVNGAASTLTLSNAGNVFAGPVTVAANAVITANATVFTTGGTLNTGNVFTTGDITFLGGTWNIRDNGFASATTLSGYGNNLAVIGNTVLSADRSNGTNTGNAVPFTNVSVGNAILTLNSGNAYSYSVAGTFTVTSPNSSVNNAVGATIAVLNGTAGGNLTKYGAGQLNVSAPVGTFTGATTVSQGVLRIAPGATSNALGSGALTIRAAGVLTNDAGTGNVVTYAPTAVTNDGLVRVQSGTADFGTRFLGASPSLGIQPVSTITERFFKQPTAFTGADGEVNATFTTANVGSLIRFENADTFLTRTPGATNTITTGTLLSFTETQFRNRGNAGTPANFIGTQTTNIGGAYVGAITIGGTIPAGVVSFGTSSDDGSSLYVDVNNDGIYQATELIVSNIADQAPTAKTGQATLAAGTYNFAIGYFNGTAGGAIEVRFAPGAGVAYTDQFIMNPGGSANTPGNIQVDTGATLIAGGFTANTATINGTGILAISAPTATASTANTLANTGTGTLNVGGVSGTNNSLTVGVLSITNGQNLTKQGAGGLYVTGLGTGSGTLNVAAGKLGGTGSVAGPVSVAAGATILGGMGTAVNQTLTTGNLTVATSTLQVLVGNGGVPTDLTGTGASLVASINLSRAGAADLITIDLISDGTILRDGTTSYTRRVATYTGSLTNLTTTTYLPADNVFAVTGTGFDVQDYNVTVTGNDVQVTFTASPVPEPLAIGLVAAVGLGMGRLIHRRRGNKQ